MTIIAEKRSITNSTHKLHFKVTGKFITQHTRDKVIEGDWEDAIRFLVEYLHGMDFNIAISILSGKQRLTGDSSIGVKLEKDSDSSDYLKRLNWVYRGYFQHSDRQWYVPYAITNSFGERDFSFFKSDYPFSRARYYLNNKEKDKIFGLKCKQFEGYEKAVLFELVKSPPIWIQIKRTAQEALDGMSSVEVRGHYEWYGEQEKPKFAKPSKQLLVTSVPKSKPLEIDSSLTSECGWLLPNGDFYGCSYSGHVYLAERLFEEILKKETNNAEDDGEKAGWVKIGRGFMDRVPFFLFNKITQSQQDTLFDWCKKHKAHYPKERIEYLTDSQE
jgi:hypothetical protein